MSNPYTRLRDLAHEYVSKIVKRRVVQAFSYEKSQDMSTAFVKASVEAAARLGYTTEVYSKNGTLSFQYVQELPQAPWELR